MRRNFSYLAALALVAAAAASGAASTESFACGIPNPRGECGNGGGNSSQTVKPGCGYGSHHNHVGPPGHDRNKGNWASDQRDEQNGVRPGNNADDSNNYAANTPQECPAGAGGK